MEGLKEAIQRAKDRHIDERYLSAKEQEAIVICLYENQKKYTKFVYNLMRQGRPIYEHAMDIAMDSIEELRSKYLSKGKVQSRKHAERLLHKLMRFSFNRYCEKRRDAAWAQKFRYGVPLGLRSPTEQWEYDRRRKYFLEHKEHLDLKNKEWRKKNHEHVKQKSREYYRKNREKILQYQKEWVKTHYRDKSKI